MTTDSVMPQGILYNYYFVVIFMSYHFVYLLSVSLRYGFGLMNAGAMTELARVWQTVPDKRKCEIPGQTGPV